MRGATSTAWTSPTTPRISIHAPLAGSDRPLAPCGRANLIFQSTLPLRGVTPQPRPPPPNIAFQSTLPLRGATLYSSSVISPFEFQSTLPLRGATCATFCISSSLPSFQSTLPLRGATRAGQGVLHRDRHFNPRSPCGERRRASGHRRPGRNFNPRSPCGERPGGQAGDQTGKISIHAPLAGSDARLQHWTNPVPPFQSTLPLRGATRSTCM